MRNVALKFFVTGGAGYIGSHMCKALHHAGHEVIVIDNLSTGNEWAVKWGPLEKIDLRDTEQLRQVFDTHKPAGVYHFAAFSYVGESVENPAKYYDNNVAGAISLLDVMRDHSCHNIVFSSTSATYGVPEMQPIDEECPQIPINPYGRSKLMIETIMKDYASAYGLRPAFLRYFNACGADPDGEIGEAHDPETHLIPRVLMAASGHIEALDVYGTDFPTEDGTAIRDYIHVCDLADGHLAAMDALAAEKEPFACNLGTGAGVSVRDVIRSVEKVTGVNVPTRETGRRPGDPPVLVASTKKANERLGFKPKYVEMDDIVETAWKWHQSS